MPALRKDSVGTSWKTPVTGDETIPISKFYLAKPVDSAATINAQLAAGKHLMFTPGVYHVTESININRANTVVMGLGLATITADQGAVAFRIADVDGVKMSGLLIDAGLVESPVLVEVGPVGSRANHSVNPTSLSDVYFRIGGNFSGQAKSSIVINSNDVIGDHFWVWRADHDGQALPVTWADNKSTNGLIVNGNDVTLYGMFVEHHNEYQTIWNGNGGRLYFYQSEMPYEMPTQASWMNGTSNGWASYKVADSVSTHEAWGLGIYSVALTNPLVKASTAIEAPAKPGIKFHNMTTVGISGEITHIINGRGDGVYTEGKFSLARLAE